MGIPSYFRKIIQKYPSIVCQRVVECGVLCFDFNCLVYRCIHAPSMKDLVVPGPGEGEALDAWEDSLLQEVRRTVKEVWDEAGRPKLVYIAVDGVVPMAKIRQQRVRRFKSAYLRRGCVGGNTWDTNSITPGTRFMTKLGNLLVAMKKEQGGQGRGWTISTSDEPGEGEHKIMKWLRASKTSETVCIYGLDADLILLSMLTGETISNTNLWLMREKQEFGSAASTVVDGVQEYTFMNLEEFKTKLGVQGRHEVLNYVGLMSLMGNDFLPHSITHKLNDDGHDCVIGELREMRRSGEWLVDSEGVLVCGVLHKICKNWSNSEESRVLLMIHKKQEQARRGVGKGMDVSEGLPLQWNVERVFLDPGAGLSKSWRSEYWKFIHPFADREHLCGEYLYGLQWILDYYTGQKEVNTSWLFPAWIPPLWSDLEKYLFGVSVSISVSVSSGSVSGSSSAGAAERIQEAQIQPAEQLAMVLPLESWGLVQDRNLRKLPFLAPQLWPLEYTFFSVGRKWLWECEARIPILTADRLREILKEAE